MAWFPKYRLEFKDIRDLLCRVDFEIETEEEIVDLEPTDYPLSFDFLASSDDLILDPVRGTIVKIGAYSPSHFYFIDFINAKNLEIRVLIYFSSTLYWKGFLVPGKYSELYDGINYPVSIVAADGLGLLTNILFVDGSGDYYIGRRTASQILFDILSKIQVTQFTEFINIYEEDMVKTVDDSPLDQYFIDCSLFKDVYCYDVLATVLKKFNAIIRQRKDGKFYIYKPCDLNQSVIYGRIFTSGTAKSSTQFAPDQFLKRSTYQNSNIWDIEGGDLGAKEAASKIIINQDYGYKDSWIFNWKLQGKTYDPVTENYQGWIHGTYWVKFSIPGEPDGIVLPQTAYSPPDDIKHSQSFGVYALDSSDVFMFSFDYRFINYSGASRSITVYLRLKSDAGSNYLYVQDEEIAAWNGSADDYEFTETVPEGKGDWNTFERKIEGIPENGSYTIQLFGISSAGSGSFVIIKDIRFYATSDLLTIKKFKKPSWWRNIWSLGREVREWEKRKQVIEFEDIEEVAINTIERENPIEGTVESFDMILGDVVDSDIDNVSEQFAGSLLMVDWASLAAAAAAFDTDHSAAFLPAVAVTHSGNSIIFTAVVAGTDFTGDTEIINTAGDLNGDIENTVSNSPGTVQITWISLSGSSGSIDITVDSETQTMEFTNPDIDATIDDFISDHQSDFSNVTFSNHEGEDLVITENNPTGGFTASVSNETGSMTGSVSLVQEPLTAVARVDTVTISGSNGTATIACNSVSRDVTIDSVFLKTDTWNSRDPGGEDEPLLEILADELKKQLSRSRITIQLPFYDEDQSDNLPHFDIIGNIQDDLNKIDGNNRIFAFNRGTFDVRNREWNADFIEIIP